MENGKKYCTIPLLENTKDRLDGLTPKAYSYDDMMNALLDMFENTKKSGVKLGKSAQNNQTS